MACSKSIRGLMTHEVCDEITIARKHKYVIVSQKHFKHLRHLKYKPFACQYDHSIVVTRKEWYKENYEFRMNNWLHKHYNSPVNCVSICSVKLPQIFSLYLLEMWGLNVIVISLSGSYSTRVYLWTALTEQKQLLASRNDCLFIWGIKYEPWEGSTCVN